MSDHKPKRPFKRPPPPDVPVRGKAIIHSSLPDPGPGPVWQDIASDGQRDWVPLWDAIGMLEPELGRQDAGAALIGRVYSGLISISCTLLEYQDRRQPANTRRYNWPSADARLSDQMRRAHEAKRETLFEAKLRTGDFCWNAFRHDPPTIVRVWGLHVDRADIEAMGMARARPAATDQPTLLATEAPSSATAPASALPTIPAEQLVREYYAAGLGWTKAWRNFQTLKAEGQYPNVSRKKFEDWFKKYDPAPKRGPKPGELRQN